MRAVCLQHVPFEGPGAFAGLLEKRGYQIDQRLVPEVGLPDDPGDVLLVMGGPMSVNDPISWIQNELGFIRDFVESGMPFVGICLGGELLAKAFGAQVAPSPRPEIGITPIWLTPEGKWHPVFREVPDPWEVFEWHGDMFDLPDGAVPLAKSDVCVQAFEFGPKAYGLLFHPEIDQAGIEALCRECPQDLALSGKDPTALLAEATPHLPQLHGWLARLVDHLLAAE